MTLKCRQSVRGRRHIYIQIVGVRVDGELNRTWTERRLEVDAVKPDPIDRLVEVADRGAVR